MNDPNWEFAKFFEDLRKNASIKTGAVMFGEAQSAYYDTLKQHMSDEEAYNMLAHTTECIIKGIAMSAGPVTEVILRMSYLFGKSETGKEVPGGH